MHNGLCVFRSTRRGLLLVRVPDTGPPEFTPDALGTCAFLLSFSGLCKLWLCGASVDVIVSATVALF